MHIIWKCISPILSKQTKQKVQILGSDWKDCLKEYIDEEVLYENWGGTKSSDNPHGDVRLGGKVPNELRRRNDDDVPEDQRITLNIPARTVGTVPIEVEEGKPNRTLKWWWKGSASDDLVFWVTRKDDENSAESIIWPPMRLCTEHIAESREIPIKTSGLYKLHFDNTASRFFSKSVSYSASVEDN
uniref:GOLD domain-containing protein n=1 Tax=Steinernema glaseri TaxID=37863 RepID=A0A1I7ZSL5_9BILA